MIVYSLHDGFFKNRCMVCGAGAEQEKNPRLDRLEGPLSPKYNGPARELRKNRPW